MSEMSIHETKHLQGAKEMTYFWGSFRKTISDIEETSKVSFSIKVSMGNLSKHILDTWIRCNLAYLKLGNEPDTIVGCSNVGGFYSLFNSDH